MTQTYSGHKYICPMCLESHSDQVACERGDLSERVNSLLETLRSIESFATMAPMDAHETLLGVLKIARDELAKGKPKPVQPWAQMNTAARDGKD